MGIRSAEAYQGYRYAGEVNHRNTEFDVLREEFKHMIQCWCWLWERHSEDIVKYLFDEGGRIEDDEAQDEETEGVDDDDDDRATVVDEDGGFDDVMFEGPPSSGAMTNTRASTSSQTEISGITGPTMYDSGSVEKLPFNDDELMIDSTFEGNATNHPLVTPHTTTYSEPEPYLSATKPPPDLKSEAQKPKNSQSYYEQLNIHESYLDGASRVCPETEETWWADMPPHFMFGETPSMAKVISDQMKEDLRKGLFRFFLNEWPELTLIRRRISQKSSSKQQCDNCRGFWSDRQIWGKIWEEIHR
jgi:hypothetical protein